MGRLDKGTRVQKRTPIVLAFFLLLVAGLFCFGSLGLIDLSNRHLFSRFSIVGILELLATVTCFAVASVVLVALLRGRRT
jgi:hypothetical protein